MSKGVVNRKGIIAAGTGVRPRVEDPIRYFVVMQEGRKTLIFEGIEGVGSFFYGGAGKNVSAIRER